MIHSQTQMNGGLRQLNIQPPCSVHKEWSEHLTAPHHCRSEITHPKRDMCEVEGGRWVLAHPQHITLESKVQPADLFNLRKSQGSIIWKCGGYI